MRVKTGYFAKGKERMEKGIRHSREILLRNYYLYKRSECPDLI
jgi:hypothetical protein